MRQLREATKVNADNRWAVIIVTTICVLFGCEAVMATEAEESPQLLDLSGLAWIGGDRFLSVSDAKNPREDDLNRVGLLTLPDSLDGLGYESIQLRYSGGPSSDFESAARIPGRPLVLLVESADDNGPFQRLFLARVGYPRPRLVDMTEWGTFTDVFNVEATAVASTSDGFKFLWAERNSGEQSTQIKWARLTLAPLRIGPQEGSVEFTLPDYLVNENGNPLFSRSIVGLDVDSAGNIYSVAAFDPEGTVENPDNGPFRSAVMQIGQAGADGVVLDETPSILAMVDGLKIESVAIRETDNGVELFVGTDDENFGGILRQLPPLDLP
jgi:hypothetical protein